MARIIDGEALNMVDGKIRKLRMERKMSQQTLSELRGELAGGQGKSAWAVAPLRGERNGNLIIIDVPEKYCVLIQD